MSKENSLNGKNLKKNRVAAVTKVRASIKRSIKRIAEDYEVLFCSSCGVPMYQLTICPSCGKYSSSIDF